ncbi:MAG: glycosyltransferase, partial [Deltaproteobacteria bacterium]|nr:glycosyltransferase [Deltaproteobacteria bacterium]
IPEETLRGWHAEGVVEWWGQRTDMPEVFANCHIACLPSYYGEGLPKALLEAAACARAIVTTDIPGCREIVKDGYNGILVPTKDVRALAQGLKQLILSPELRSEMGRHGREMAVSEFSVERVVQETLTVYREMISP